MAFTGKFGSLFRQTTLRNTVSIGQVPVTSMLNGIRCMSTKLFVGGLSWGTDDNQLREAFATFGDVTEARVIVDRDTGRSRGFGFVNFTSEESAQSAMQTMDGKDLQGRNIRVNLANDRPSGGGFGGGDFGGGGGYRGGSGGGGYGGGNDGF